MSVKQALLAFLADGPSHGYDLKTRFDGATGSAWPLNVGQVYTTLQRHERDGLVVPHGVPDSEGRQPYRLTAEGREALAEWFDSPVIPKVATRDDVSMKVLVAVATGAAEVDRLIADQRNAALEASQSFTSLKRESGQKSLAWRLHLERLLLAINAEVRWLDVVESQLNATQGQK